MHRCAEISLSLKKYLNKSTIGTQFFPDADEIKNMYADKPVNVIVTTLLENLDSITVPNKNEHILQFFNLYQKIGANSKRFLFFGLTQQTGYAQHRFMLTTPTHQKSRTNLLLEKSYGRKTRFGF